MINVVNCWVPTQQDWTCRGRDVIRQEMFKKKREKIVVEVAVKNLRGKKNRQKEHLNIYIMLKQWTQREKYFDVQSKSVLLINLALLFDFFQPFLSTYLDKIHGHKPHEVSVLGELLQILSNSDGFVCLSKWSMTNTQPGGRHTELCYCKRQNDQRTYVA